MELMIIKDIGKQEVQLKLTLQVSVHFAETIEKSVVHNNLHGLFTCYAYMTKQFCSIGMIFPLIVLEKLNSHLKVYSCYSLPIIYK